MSPRGQCVILVVEDDEQVRNLLVEVLTDAGYTVISTADGRHALEVAAGTKIDLLLTDLILPGGLSGVEVASKLSADDPNMKLLVMSGYGADFAEKRLSELFVAGIDEIMLEKPVKPDRLLDAVKRALSGIGQLLYRRSSRSEEM